MTRPSDDLLSSFDRVEQRLHGPEVLVHPSGPPLLADNAPTPNAQAIGGGRLMDLIDTRKADRHQRSLFTEPKNSQADGPGTPSSRAERVLRGARRPRPARARRVQRACGLSPPCRRQGGLTDDRCLLGRDAARAVDGHFDLGVAAHAGAVPETVCADLQVLGVLVAVLLDSALSGTGSAGQARRRSAGDVDRRRTRDIVAPERPDRGVGAQTGAVSCLSSVPPSACLPRRVSGFC